MRRDTDTTVVIPRQDECRLPLQYLVLGMLIGDRELRKHVMPDDFECLPGEVRVVGAVDELHSACTKLPNLREALENAFGVLWDGKESPVGAILEQLRLDTKWARAREAMLRLKQHTQMGFSSEHKKDYLRGLKRVADEVGDV